LPLASSAGIIRAIEARKSKALCLKISGSLLRMSPGTCKEITLEVPPLFITMQPPLRPMGKDESEWAREK